MSLKRWDASNINIRLSLFSMTFSTNLRNNIVLFNVNTKFHINQDWLLDIKS